jgi:nucleoid DNA-binding protein
VGSDTSAPLVREFELAREVYKNTDLPMWVIKKVMSTFFAVLIKMLKEGKFIHIAKIGSFAPYRMGDRGWQRANREPTRTYLHYKWKVGKSLKEDIRQATTKEKDDDSRDVQDQDNDDMGNSA